MKLDKADQYFSIWIRLRDKACKRCLSKVQTNEKGLPISHQNSHFHGRRKESTRFEPLNCDTLCGGCHMFLTSNPQLHYEWQLHSKGQETLDKLTIIANTYKKKDRKLEAIYWKARIKEDFGIVVN